MNWPYWLNQAKRRGKSMKTSEYKSNGSNLWTQNPKPKTQSHLITKHEELENRKRKSYSTNGREDDPETRKRLNPEPEAFPGHWSKRIAKRYGNGNLIGRLKNQAEPADFFQNVPQFLLTIPMKWNEEEEDDPTELAHIDEDPFLWFVQNLMETVWQRRMFMREKERVRMSFSW